jgi:hypothetical protein
MTTPLDIDPVRSYHGVYARLVDLCERQAELSEESHLCVMEAFNEVADIDVGLPSGLPDIYYGPVGDVMHQIRHRLTDLIVSSTDLRTALAFIRVDTCIEAAIENQR